MEHRQLARWKRRAGAPLLPVVLVLVVTAGGCSTLKTIGNEFAAPFREDPARAALFMVKREMIDVRTEVFIPTCDLQEPTGSDVGLCDLWKRKIDPAITAAHDKALTGLEIAESGETRLNLAADVVALAISSLDDVMRIDDHVGRRDVYRRARGALAAVLVGLSQYGVRLGG